MAILPYLHRIVTKEDLRLEDARAAMRTLLTGEESLALVTAFLAALRTKGETAEELAGFAMAMREAATPVPLDLSRGPVVDTCGTGGDGAHTFNISTVAAFVVAGCGVRVAKHGNRAISSRCGSADVLEKLGIPLLSSASVAARAIEETGIGFLFAPAFHPAVRHVMPARLELKMRTAFNLLGPLANPANASHQVVGAPGLREARVMAEALAQLPVKNGFVVHGSDGLDEVTTTGSTTVFTVIGAAATGAPRSVNQWEFDPRALGIDRASSEDLLGGDAETNAEIVRRVLGNEAGPHRDIVLVNAAFSLVAAELVADLEEGWRMAADCLSSGHALARLQRLREFCAAHPPEQH
ncbi:MAG: anthranilate phosphoribosyltransferase [Bryobacterales bacterium]|nr:anthranilate phosphoribosyltransferase [Bryobacterales bacterium]